MIGCLLAISIASTPVHAFRIGTEWVVLDDAGLLKGRYPRITDETVLDGDVAPDGTFFVLSISSEASGGRLARWKVGNAKLEMFVEERGFYGAPRFSRDGAWLFVAHYPHGGGLPGAHAPMEYAQLYKINVASRQMQKITNSVGCHMSSFSHDGSDVFFGHSTCKGQKRLEKLTTRGSLVSTVFQAEVSVAEKGGLLDEPALSRDGTTMVFTRTNGNQVELVAESRGGTRILFAGPAYGPLRPAVKDKNEVLFQHGRRVLSVSLFRPNSLTVLFEG